MNLERMKLRSTLSSILLILGFSVASLCAASERAGDSYARLPFSTISAEDGLSNDSVYCLLQDKQGFVWAGTFGGLDRWDGKEFVSFKPGSLPDASLSASVVFALAEGPNGEIWIGTDGGGLNRLDPKTGRIKAYRGAAAEGPGSDLVYALAADVKGDLWIGTGGSGLTKRNGADGSFDRFTTENSGLSSNIVRALLLDARGRLWVGTTNGGLLMSAKPGAKVPRFETLALAGAGKRATIRAVCEDTQGRIWVGTEGNGLFVVPSDGSPPVRAAMPVAQGGDRSTVRAIASDGEGRIWVGTEGSGVAVFEPDLTWLSLIQRSEPFRGGLAGDQVRAVMRDRSGLMWVGLKDRGISIGNPAAPSFGVHRADGSKGLPRGTVRGFSEDSSGSLWIASDGGSLIRYDSALETWQAYGMLQGLASSRLCSVLVARDGSVYAGSDGAGLFRVPPDHSQATSVDLGPGNDSGVASEGGAVVWAIYEDRRGSIWVGLEGSGLVELKKDGSRVRYRYSPDSPSGLGGRSVRCLLEDSDGSLLIGTWDGGLQRLDPESGKIERFPTQGNSDASTSDVSIYCIVRDSRGRIWIGTGSGLDRWESGLDAARITSVPLGPLPRRPSVFGIAEDSSGSLWLSTETGLLRFDPETGRLRTWTRSDGLQDDHFAAGSFLRLSDGRLAFGGTEGFNLFDPADLNLPPAPPQVRIVSLVPLDGIGPAERSVAVPAEGDIIRVSYANSGFAISLAVLDFTDPGKNLHALRIEGRQDQRYYLGTSHTAIIPRLAPGRYRFIAAGAGNRGLWNEAGSSVTVEVVPPFWTTPYALVALGTLAALAIFGGFRLRLARLERRTEELRDLSAHIHDAREEERAEIAREVHDQLGQTLTAVKIGLFWAKDNVQVSGEAMGERLVELLGYTDLALESVKSISTRLRPSVLDTLSLREALEWLVRDFRRWSAVSCQTNFDPTPFNLEKRTKTTIFRVLQENLTNVARHSGATEAIISLSVDEERLELTVRDNGKGIDPELTNLDRSFGIAGMRERCSYLGGSFEIYPAPGGGTLMVACLPNLRSVEGIDA
ncbi:hypothetical protein MASR2M78_08780 [Treponema sp.]